MSFLTGTQTELMYASIATGTQLNTFTTEDSLQKTLAPVVIPANFWFNPAGTSKSIKVKAYGQLGTTGAPTFLWTARLLTSTTWSAGGISLGATAALTAGTTQTLAPWTLDLDITMRTISVGGASTAIVQGEVRSPLGLASPFAGTIPTNNTALTVATIDTTTTYYLFLSATCGTSNAANLIQLTELKVYGEN